MTGFPVDEVAIPAGTHDPAWAAFAEAVELHYAVEAETYATADLALTPLEAWPEYCDSAQPVRLFAARVEGRVVGTARYQTAESDVAWLAIDVQKEHRRRGIGSELLASLDELAGGDGIRKQIVYAPSPPGPGDQLVSPTGFGTLSLANPDVAFLRAHGFRLEQVVRASRLALPVHVHADFSAARSRALPDYRLHHWIGAAPERWYADLVTLRTAMSVEEPSAGLEEPEDVWTVERMLDEEAHMGETPRSVLVIVVEHVATGTLVGLTALFIPDEPARAVAQGDTLVLPGHRGHRLGMLLKLAGLDILQSERAGHPSIVTFNAEENRHMLDVNEAVGFVPIGYEGAWRRDLA